MLLLIDHHFAKDGAEKSRSSRRHAGRLDVDVASVQWPGALHVQHRPVDGVVEPRNETAHVAGPLGLLLVVGLLLLLLLLLL